MIRAARIARNPEPRWWSPETPYLTLTEGDGATMLRAMSEKFAEGATGTDLRVPHNAAARGVSQNLITRIITAKLPGGNADSRLDETVLGAVKNYLDNVRLPHRDTQKGDRGWTFQNTPAQVTEQGAEFIAQVWGEGPIFIPVTATVAELQEWGGFSHRGVGPNRLLLAGLRLAVEYTAAKNAQNQQ